MSDDGEYKCHVLKTATEPGIKTDPPVTLTVLGMIKQNLYVTYLMSKVGHCDSIFVSKYR